jgi:biopolymer transport protein ExbD
MSSDHNTDKAEPNLTPLLDMVFQLITFFMLVFNIKGQSVDLTLKLPVLGSARPLDKEGKMESMVLNIDAEGHVKAYGKEVKDIEQFIEREAHNLINELKYGSTPVKDGELPVPVIIRADRSAPFHLVNQVLKACQDRGYRQFSLNAMTREEKPQGPG